LSRDPTGTVVVRPLAGDREVDAFFALATATFAGYQRVHSTPAPGGSVAAGWRRFVEGMPAFRPTHLRGAFDDGGRLLGGYLHEERWLRVGGVPLRSGYVGAVVVEPAYRGRGVAAALMLDGVALARREEQALLVLRGIADYYGRFGYADVMETTEHCVDPTHVLAHDPPGPRVRPATVDDAPALLAIHERHYAAYTGSYVRTLAQQAHFLRHRGEPPLVAVDAAGVPSGYLLLPGGSDRAAAVEAAADSWPAALALLQYHAACAAGAPELRWPLPPGSTTHCLLADHLPLRGETRSRPNAGFMARPGSVAALFDGLVPLWRERWRRVRPTWSGVLVLDVEGVCCCLELTDDLRRLARAPTGACVVALTPQSLAQLVFGFRPARQLAIGPPAALDVLFPPGVGWYPASNRC